MLRFRGLARAFPPRPAQHRPFVSTVLLSRTWENETLVELRKEAKARSLSTGNKSALIARIQEYEGNRSLPLHTPAATRSASTISPPASPPAFQAASPGIPLAAPPASASTSSDFLPIKLPDLSQPAPNTPVQVPYVPDFWDSARLKADIPSEPELPKLHVISGSATHYDGGPTHNLEKHQEGYTPPPTTVKVDDSPSSKEVGFWADLWESLGLPRSFSARRTLSEAANLVAQAVHDGSNESQHHSRPLTGEERKGLYILLGILGGSWVIGGVVNRPALAEEEHQQ